MHLYIKEMELKFVFLYNKKRYEVSFEEKKHNKVIDQKTLKFNLYIYQNCLRGYVIFFLM